MLRKIDSKIREVANNFVFYAYHQWDIPRSMLLRIFMVLYVAFRMIALYNEHLTFVTILNLILTFIIIPITEFEIHLSKNAERYNVLRELKANDPVLIIFRVWFTVYCLLIMLTEPPLYKAITFFGIIWLWLMYTYVPTGPRKPKIKFGKLAASNSF